jgi:hypothetical protein
MSSIPNNMTLLKTICYSLGVVYTPITYDNYISWINNTTIGGKYYNNWSSVGWDRCSQMTHFIKCIYSDVNSIYSPFHITAQSNICQCGSEECEYDCGVLSCGCIDVCRGRCGLRIRD